MELFLKFPVVTMPPANLLPKARPVPRRTPLPEKTIPMLVYRTERQMTCPRFKSIAIQTETEITGKSNKEYIFPMIVATFQTLGMACAFCSKRSTCKADNQEWTVSFGKEARME